MATDQLRSACARTDDEIALIANRMRRDIIEMLGAAGSGHPGGSLSATDLMATLFFSGLLGMDPADPNNPERDRFILSKGHAAPALYAIFVQLGYIPHDEILTLRQVGSRLQGHPDRHACPGVEGVHRLARPGPLGWLRHGARPASRRCPRRQRR